jgi:organic hydroperoxide reductase OsmC/OhrA
MRARLKNVLYTAEAVVEGGRQGRGWTRDGRLEVAFSVPAAMSGDDGLGTNPEELFALGYAACFQSAVLAVARAATSIRPGCKSPQRSGSDRSRPATSGFGSHSTSTHRRSASRKPAC